jgi:hypothetical protein
MELITFCVNANPVEVPGQFLRDISLPSSWETNHGNDVGAVDIVSTLTCTNIIIIIIIIIITINIKPLLVSLKENQ